MAQGPETRLVNRIIKELRKRGGWWMKVHGGIYQKGGVPDILGFYEGQGFALEVKLPDGTYGVTPRQEATMREMHRDGGCRVSVVTSIEEASWAVYGDG